MNIILKRQRDLKKHTHIATDGGLSAKPLNKLYTQHQKHKKPKKTTHIATDGGLPARPIKKPMHIASKTQKNQKTDTYAN